MVPNQTETLVSYFDDNEKRLTGIPRRLFFDGPRPEKLHLAKDITCKKCGAECYWQEVIDAKGEPVVRLFESGKPHECNVDDMFEVQG